MRRDAHPKHHAVVRGELVVPADVPEDLKHGVFATPGRVPAWIRFSNGAPLAGPDRRRDQRGCAIKLVGVPGPKLLDSEREAVTQDFLLASAKCFFLRDASDYVGFARAAAKKPAFRVLAFFFGWNPWKWRGHEFRALVGGLTRARDLLSLSYWSQVPYQLGPHVVKYALTPIDPPPLLPDSRSPDFLRERLASHLAAHPARFAFSIQRRRNPGTMPIEDATVEWPLTDAPLERVATLEIEPQRFDSPEQMALAEHLSFTPWHSLPAHEPIGSINRMRREVYEAVSAHRHKRNGVIRREPTNMTIEADLITPAAGNTGGIIPPRPRSVVSRFVKLAAIVAAVAAVLLLVLFLRGRSDEGPEPVDAAPLPARPAPVGSNGLSDSDRAAYYHLSEGGELYPLDWLLALEVEYPGTAGGPGLRRPFLDNIERYGLLPDPKRRGNPYGLPVGVSFGRSHLSGQMMMGINCTACHVGQVEYGGRAVRIDGGPSMGFINAFVVDMLLETQKTLMSPRRLTRFWSRVRQARAARRALGASGEADETPAPDEGWLKRLTELLTNNRGLLEGKVAALRNVPILKAAAAVSTLDGYGRTDAFGVGRNELFGSIPLNGMPSDAPVSFPHVWGMEHTAWLQWGANTNSVMERNIGQSLGVGAVFDPATGRSSVNIENLWRMEQYAYRLHAPAWPDVFPAVDPDKAERGRLRFKTYCAPCHQTWQTDGQMRIYQLFALNKVGTDPSTAINFEKPVKMADGRVLPFPYAALELIAKVKHAAYTERHLSREDIDRLENRSVRKGPAFEPTFRAPLLDSEKWSDTKGRKVYRSKTLVGIWATAPFLHNGSVPTIFDLLHPAAERPTQFRVGHHEYDPVKLGIETDPSRLSPPPNAMPYELDTRLPGNWNTGHEWWFYPSLDDTQRFEIIEFLKIFNDEAALDQPVAGADVANDAAIVSQTLATRP